MWTNLEIGDKTIPDSRLPELIGAVKTLYGKFTNSEVDHDTAASLLGHSTSRSGAYRQKIADLRSFGLIEGRGTIRVSETGRKLSYPNQGEESEGLIEAISRIELWKHFYEKYTSKGLDLPSDVWVDVRAWTGSAPEIAKNKSDFVRKSYYEDIKYLRASETPKPEVLPMGSPEPATKIDTSASKPPEGYDELRLGDIRLWLPKSGDQETIAKKAISLISLHSGIEVEFKASKKKVEA